jgi:hypothetical protein
MIDTMPSAALKITPIDYTLTIENIIKFLNQLSKQY